MPRKSRSTNPRPSRRAKRTACADCNTLTTVPFRLKPGRPVYCRPCFKNRRNGHSSPAKGPVSKSHTTTKPIANITSAAAFPKMALKVATKEAISKMNISDPTPIQAKSIPHLLAGRDLIGQARTGSGKTLVFAVPMAENLNPSVRRVQALVLVPTRELAIQVAKVTEALASSQRLRVTLLYGGRSLRPEYKALKSGPQVIIGTPGRTLDHLRQGTLDLRSVQFLVLDEADEMLDKGFCPRC